MSYQPNYHQEGYGGSGFQMPQPGHGAPVGGYGQQQEPHIRDGYQPSYLPPPASGYAPPPGPPAGYTGPPLGYAPPAGPPSSYGGYSAPPGPPSAYGGYSAPPGPPSAYGAPPGPPPSAYGAPPGPPPVNTQSYPGQQQQQNTIYYLNTPIPPLGAPPPTQGLPGYNANADVEKLRQAMRGMGTKESLLIQTLTPLSAMHLAVLSASFRASTGKELLQNIDNETSGRLKDVLTALVRGPLEYDVKLVHQALSGAGTDEQLLTEIIADRSPSDLYHLGQAYRAKHGRSLEQAVKSDLSGKTERLFTMIISSNRPPDNTPVDRALVEADVHALYKAGQGKIGTDEIAFCNIIVNRTTPHLTALWDAYHRQHGKTLSKVIKNEFSGHMKTALLYIVTAANPKRINEGPGVWRDMKRLEDSMKGMGTKDDMLIRRLVRAHWDASHFTLVKRAYERKYRKTLESRVAGETSGDYKKAVVGIVRGTQ